MIQVQPLKLKIGVTNAMQDDHITPPHSVHNINYMIQEYNLILESEGNLHCG